MAVSGVNKNPSERNAEATIHIGQLDDKVTDALLWELMQQAAPVKHVYIPRDRITGKHFGYGFCEFQTPLDAAYANKVLNMVNLFGKPLRLSQSAVDRRTQDVGANLFIGNLSEDTDEKLLHDAFATFGPLIEPAYVMRDASTGSSKLFGFVKYATFEAADKAIAIMNGENIGNRPIVVQYAFKKDGKDRERHGSEAERMLAKRARESATFTPASALRQHVLFSDRPPPMSAGGIPVNVMLPPEQALVPSTHSWLQGHVAPQMAQPGAIPPGADHGSTHIGWAPRSAGSQNPQQPYPMQQPNNAPPASYHVPSTGSNPVTGANRNKT